MDKNNHSVQKTKNKIGLTVSKRVNCNNYPVARIAQVKSIVIAAAKKENSYEKKN
jgi:hypothetical protein